MYSDAVKEKLKIFRACTGADWHRTDARQRVGSGSVRRKEASLEVKCPSSAAGSDVGKLVSGRGGKTQVSGGIRRAYFVDLSLS